MAKPRGLYSQIFKNFLNSIRPRNLWGELKGKDQYGTEYYEGEKSKGTSRASRWYVPVNKDLQYDLPIEWEAWLRHKRKDPPTQEEIQYNLQCMRQTIENAKKLEPPKTDNGNMKTFEKVQFPVYEDYQDKPEKPKN